MMLWTIQQSKFSCTHTLGGDIISNALSRSNNTTLKKVAVDNVTDETANGLMNWMALSNSLVDLSIDSSSVGFGTPFYSVLATYLSNQSCVLARLGLYCSRVGHDCQIMLTDAIKQNKSLVTLKLTNRQNAWNWDLFAQVLCDGSSFDATYQSNHTLQEIKLGNGYPEIPNEDVKLYLKINELETGGTSKVAHLKIYEKHLKGGDIDMQPFEDMDLGVMPYVLAYLGDSGSYTRRHIGSPETLLILYNFIRGMTAFMDLGSSGTNQAHKKVEGIIKQKTISR